MYKKLVLAILAIAILGCCNVVSADNMQDLGTVEYRDYSYKYFDGSVNIVFVFSVIGEEHISIERIYDNVENETRYKFISHEIVDPEWWMNFTDDVLFYYQMVENSTIYKISVNYSEVEIPLSPWETDLISLEENHTILIESMSILSTNYSSVFGSYNSTLASLEAKITEFNVKSAAFDNLFSLHSSMLGDINLLNASLDNMTRRYNNTYNLLIDAGKNLSYYRMFFDGMTGYKDGFWFDNVYYLTVDENANIVRGLKDELGVTPLYTILAIALTALILFFLFRVMSGKKNPTAIELERDYNYTPESRAIDNFVNFFKKKAETKKDEKIVVPIIPLKQEIVKPTEKEPEPIPKPKVDASVMKEEIISAVKQDLESLIKKAVTDAISHSTNKEATA